MKSDPASESSESVSVASPDGERFCRALASETGRQVVIQLREQPRTPSELADQLDVTPQNVHHHLDNLTEAGIVEVHDAVYTENGNEVNLFRTTTPAMTLVFGREEPDERRVDELGRLVGSVTILALGTYLLRTSEPLIVRKQATVQPASDPGVIGWLTLHPDIAFFVGGIVALTISSLLEYLRKSVLGSP